MRDLSAICVYCGAADGDDPQLVTMATDFGRLLARAGIRLIYGGGGSGMMGAVAKGTLDAGGRVTGIIPDFLAERERMLATVTDLHVVGDMHDRKLRLMHAADGFVVLPGGLGTLEETFEVLTWRQLALHDKPIVIANLLGYWDPLISLIEHVIANRFAGESVRGLSSVARTVPEILEQLRAAPAPSHRDRTGLI